MFDELQRQTESVLRVGKRGHAGGGHGDAVVTAPSAYDFPFLRLAAGGLVIPDYLDRGVVGLRSGRTEKCLAHRGAVRCRRCDFDQVLGKVHRRSDRLAGKAVIEGKLSELRDGGIDKLRLRKAERCAP